ncbi:unnamed protein product [Clonostachys byssicola]|uniref:Zn(2)-C6 fungal-type domain-containing protein n=1 Tax=Clonostachys byssicola TaxID=160290 RepID=A0A9N9Y6B8_9HYPO|nr:unnamed protein product [Clonostachys byssicola]
MERGSAAGESRSRTDGGVGTPRNRVLSCVNCRQRKIFCTKDIPCGNCIKNNIPCIPSKPAPSRPRHRSTAQDIRERLAKCETLLQEYATVDESAKSRSGQEGPTNPNNDIPPANSEAISESAGKHVDGGLWVTLNDEVFALQAASQAFEADQQYR